MDFFQKKNLRLYFRTEGSEADPEVNFASKIEKRVSFCYSIRMKTECGKNHSKLITIRNLTVTLKPTN